MLREDFLLNEDGDFPLQDTVVAGVYLDTPYGVSEEQHVKDLVFYEYGALKAEPLLGFGINKYFKSEVDIQAIEKLLKRELEKDGYSFRPGCIIPKEIGFEIDSRFIYKIK